MYINANINGFKTPIELPEIFAEREQVQTSDDPNNSYVIRQGNLVEIGGVVTINTTPVTKGTGTEGSKRVDLSSYGFTKILNVQATAEDTPAGSIHENAHIGDVDTQGFAVYATSTHTAPVEFKVRYLVRAIA
jgi:hypothetical protein|nr:MAG TPA: hypothetical protein [Caudoviricetes sp.]